MTYYIDIVKSVLYFKVSYGFTVLANLNVTSFTATRKEKPSVRTFLQNSQHPAASFTELSYQIAPRSDNKCGNGG
jgi:hypothetical protein